MHDDDPLVAGDLQPVLPGTAPRHAADRTLVTSDGEPISLTGPPLDPLVRRDAAASQGDLETLGLEVTDLVAQISRVGRDVILLGIITVLALIAALVGGWFALSDRSTLQDLQARQTKSDVAHAQTEDLWISSQCTALSAMRRTYSVTARNAFPLGGTAYDAYFASLTKAAATAGCAP